jgi:hypothetical protein
VTHFAKLAVVVSGCVLGWSGAGCSPSNSGGPADGTPVSLDQFPARFAGVVCDTVGPCCKAASVAYDAATCKTAVTSFAQRVVSMNTAPRTTYDAAAAGACLSAVQTTLESCINFDDSSTGVACAHIFVGSVPLGGACLADSDCAADGSCASDPNDPTSAVCVPAHNETVHAKAGEACGSSCVQLKDSVTECTSGPIAAGGSTGGSAPATSSCYAEDGLFCSSQTQVCETLVPIGEACADRGCVPGSFCDLGKCMAQLDSGPCTGSTEACSAKSYCDGTSRQCLPRLADGSPCEISEECSSDECSETADPNKRVCGPPTAATPALCAGQLD